MLHHATQVEPVKWSSERMRKVLNNAILSGLVADEMITAAEQALTDGFEGSLSRSARLCAQLFCPAVRPAARGMDMYRHEERMFKKHVVWLDEMK